MDIRIFGGEGKSLGKRSDVPTNTVARFNNVTGKPSSSVVKPPTIQGRNKPSATVTRLEDTLPAYNAETNSRTKRISKPLVTGQTTILPGSRTPDNKRGPKNKPVSQGGVAKFNDKRSRFHLSDFSDSDDDILCSIPFDDSSKTCDNVSSECDATTVTHEMDFKEFDSSESSSCRKVDDTKVEWEEFAGSNDFEDSGGKDRIELENIENTQPSDRNSDSDDVRAMLRKVWGQKQFGNKNNRMKVRETFRSGNIYPENTIEKGTVIKDIQSAHKRLSWETGFNIAQANKRQRSDEGIYIEDRGNTGLDSDTNLHTERDLIKSGIEKFFNNATELSSQHSCESQQTKQLDSDMQTSNAIRANNSNIDETRTNSSEEMSACPICSKPVLTASINEHLDLCLTIQAI